MADIFPVSGTTAGRSSHLIVFHGLGGHYQHTWQAKKGDAEAWPWWVESEFPDIGVWLVSYEAAVSFWRGNSMHLPDRARNVAARLLLEDALRSGDIAMLGHSLGGLVIKELLRALHSQAHGHPEAASFLKRVRRVGFLGTPHAGADLGSIANWLRVLVRPSLATSGLQRNDPNLRSLNLWYRAWARETRPDQMILFETRASGPFFVVKPDSSDAGIDVDPIPIDANHSQICKPATRNSEVYKHIQRFLSRTALVSGHGPGTETDTSSTEIYVPDGGPVPNGTAIERKAAATVAGIAARLETGTIPRELVDREIQARLEKLIKARPFGEFQSADYANELAREIRVGQLSGGSSTERANALAWCARVLAAVSLQEATDLLRAARAISTCPAVDVAEAFLAAFNGKHDDALLQLSKLNEPLARSAALRIVDMRDGPNGPIKWLTNSGIEFESIDPDGKFTILRCMLRTASLDNALALITEISEAEYEDFPALTHLAGLINLLSIVPPELRDSVSHHLPIELKAFPLSADAGSLERLKSAEAQFVKFALLAGKLGLKETAALSADYGLWLRCRDVESQAGALAQIREDLRSTEVALRRIPFALSFGIKVDVAAVEREISKRVTFTGGGDSDAALARLALALNQKEPAAIAEYLKLYREELERVVDLRVLTALQVQTLAKSGQSSTALAVLATAVDKGHLSSEEETRLREIIAEDAGSNDVEAKLKRYREGPSLPNLIDLVEHLESERDWPRAVEFGRILFNQTGSLPDATRLGRAMANARQNQALYEFLGPISEIVAQSTELKELWAWSLMHAGRFEESKLLVNGPLADIDTANLRNLRLTLCVVSGDWEALPGLLDAHWRRRDARMAEELLSYADIAIRIGYARAVDLINESVRRGGGDAKLLAGAYMLAQRSGGQIPAASDWLQAAAAQSNDDGPLRKVSLKELVESQPNWEQRASELWDKSLSGILPQFALAKGLNRTLLDLHIRPAFVNEGEPDGRKHRLILAYSGSRSATEDDPKSLVLDPTALLTLAYIDVIDQLLHTDIALTIPHRTFSWLWEELNRLKHHQPKQLEDSKQIRDGLARGAITTVPRSVGQDGLEAIVGSDLADLLTYSAITTDSLVVRSSPVYRLGSLMEEEANLDAHKNVLVSCGAVARYLNSAGQLTVEEFKKAETYLGLQEKEWEPSKEITPATTLLLDDLSISYLQATNLLEPLLRIGQKIKVPVSAIAESDEILKGDAVASDVVHLSESLRRKLSDAVASGRITCAPDFLGGEDDNLGSHPAAAVFRSAQGVDAIVVDDRALNRHKRFSSDGSDIPVLTSLDVLSLLERKGHLERSERYAKCARLRTSGFAFVPVSEDELLHHLQRATVLEGVVIETSELRGLRRSLLIARMRGLPRLPAEAAWVDEVQKSVIGATRSLWTLDATDEVCAARANWLLGLVDTRGWSACFDGGSGVPLAEHGMGIQLMNLLTPRPSLPQVARLRFTNWLAAVVVPLAKDDPRVFEWMKAHVGRLLVALGSDVGDGERDKAAS